MQSAYAFLITAPTDERRDTGAVTPQLRRSHSLVFMYAVAGYYMRKQYTGTSYVSQSYFVNRFP